MPLTRFQSYYRSHFLPLNTMFLHLLCLFNFKSPVQCIQKRTVDDGMQKFLNFELLKNNIHKTKV